MAGVNRLFWELKFEVLKIAVFRSLLNASIFFLILNIAFTLFNVNIIFAIILAGIFLFINIYIVYASMTLKRIEDANPEVREMLRTARDSMGQDTIMARALHQEVLSKAKKIYSGNLMSYRRFVINLAIIGVLVIATIFISTVHVSKINIPFDRLGFSRSLSGSPPINLEDVSLEDSDKIYGESRVARLGNDVISLKLSPSISELDLNHITDEQGTDLSMTTYPVDIGTPRGAEVGGAKKPEESELVNAFYMKKIKR